MRPSVQNPTKSSYNVADELSRHQELHRSSMSWQMRASTSLPHVLKEYAEHVKSMYLTAKSITVTRFLMTLSGPKIPACFPAFRAVFQNARNWISRKNSNSYDVNNYGMTRP